MVIPDEAEELIIKVTDMCKWAPRNIVQEFRDDAVGDLTEAILEGDTMCCYASEQAIKRIDAIAKSRWSDWRMITCQ